MAVVDIKAFINDKQEEMYYADKGDYFIPPNDVGEILEAILNMLDELDTPKAKWIKDECGDYHCEKCNAIIEKDEWERHNNYYCYHCGAKMNDELV